MANNYYHKKQKENTWHKALVLGLLFLGLALTSMAQGKRHNAPEAKARKAGVTARNLRQVLANRGPQILRDGETARRPRNAQHSYWDVPSNSWQLAYNHTYTYNGAGILVEDAVTEASNSNFSRIVSEYDDHNNETRWAQYYWEDGRWLLFSEYNTTYTYVNNRITETVYEEVWNGERRTTKEVYTYNSAGNPIEIVESEKEGNVWVNTDKTMIEYANGSTRPTAVTEQEWSGNAWVNTDREINLVWHDAPNTDQGNWLNWYLAGATEQEWQNGAWVSESRFSTTFQENGGYTEIGEEWENNAWVNDYRYRVVNDQHGNTTLTEEESWRNNRWEIDLGHKSTHTYASNGDLTQTISQSFDNDEDSPTKGTYQNFERWVYSNYQNVLSSKEELNQLAGLVYPNPVSGKFTVKLEKAAGASVEVVSLAGQTVFNTTLTKALEGEAVDISSLPAGTYILKLHSKAGVRTQKIVKL
ncbi:T9SS type A sorting domain-containing protein [Rufibacter psychrotolerans]|uniref:T9SS type A sorting domain-containing protein n=1 Tax=Rufibacter psychrotolerans TaxID=2812556 RepID=UPI001967EE23|nr:T9SS type A sorting domain-containing protein [Rufibacter sp. SYSU D00308]